MPPVFGHLLLCSNFVEGTKTPFNNRYCAEAALAAAA
jgi:hypothetical protein